MKHRTALIAGAVTIGLMITGIAWAVQDSGSTLNVSLADNQQVEIPVNDAGVVVLSRANGQLQIVTATPSAGYASEVEVAAGREVEADFRGNGERVQFNAELEDGAVTIRIRTEASDDSGSTSTTGSTSSTGSTSPTGSTSTTVTAVANGSGTLTLSDGQVTQVQVADAGTVLLRRNSSTLTIVSTQVNAGWAVEVEVSTGREVEGDFRNGSQRVKFNFEFEDGVIRVRIESEGSNSNSTGTTSDDSGNSGSSDDSGNSGSSDDSGNSGTSAGVSVPNGTVTYNLDGAGTVSIVFANGSMSIGSISPAAGWTTDNSEQLSNEIKVELTNGDEQAELRIRIENGQARVEIERKS